MTIALFSLILISELATTAAVAWSLARPACRIWPPPRPRAWQGYALWLLFLTSACGLILLGLVDWGRWPLASWLRLGLGLPLWLAGNGLATWAMITLGLATTFGREGGLVRRGPYRFSRNPQYLGFLLGLLGWGLLAASVWTLVAALAGIPPLLLVPLAEEPWLAAQHGAAYDDYRRAVPRFFSLRRQ